MATNTRYGFSPADELCVSTERLRRVTNFAHGSRNFNFFAFLAKLRIPSVLFLLIPYDNPTLAGLRYILEVQPCIKGLKKPISRLIPAQMANLLVSTSVLQYICAIRDDDKITKMTQVN